MREPGGRGGPGAVTPVLQPRTAFRNGGSGGFAEGRGGGDHHHQHRGRCHRSGVPSGQPSTLFSNRKLAPGPANGLASGTIAQSAEHARREFIHSCRVTADRRGATASAALRQPSVFSVFEIQLSWFATPPPRRGASRTQVGLAAPRRVGDAHGGSSQPRSTPRISARFPGPPDPRNLPRSTLQSTQSSAERTSW